MIMQSNCLTDVCEESFARSVFYIAVWVGSFNCNTNGVVIAGNYKCGGVFRHELGAWLGGFDWNLRSCSVLMSKLWGIYSTFQLAYDKGYQMFFLKSNSTLQRFLKWFQSLSKIHWTTCYRATHYLCPRIKSNNVGREGCVLKNKEFHIGQNMT